MTTPDMRLDPYPHYAKMRSTAPVFFNQDKQVWEVYGYHDIQTILGDPDMFSSDMYSAAKRPELQTMITMDPPRHTQFRKLISRAFTTKVIAALEPRIEAISEGLLGKVIGTGRMDVVTDFALPLPVTVIGELLGTPSSDRDKFKHWSDHAVAMAEMAIQGLAPTPHQLEAVKQFTEYLEALAIQRREKPGEDLISGLATAIVDGEQLTIKEIAGTCRLLLIAGYETTTNLIGNAMYLLLQHPDSLAQLHASPELLPDAIEEILRYRAPAQFFGRIATRDVTVGGQAIRAGQKLAVFNASGNRDATAFADPDRFDITRSPNRHLSFGYGIHFCLGAGLGRVEARIGIGALLKHLSNIQLDEQTGIEPLSSSMHLGFRRLGIQFTPTSRR